MNIPSAVNFIRSSGSLVEKASLAYLLNGELPDERARAALLAGQRSDGGFQPFWKPGYSSLDATCFRLAQAHQVGLTAHDDSIARALQFLSLRQSADGSWEEDQTVAAYAPPWAVPGDLAARCYLTANCGLWLAVFGGNAESSAAGFLAAQLGVSGQLPSFLNAHWLAGGLLYLTGFKDSAGSIFDYLRFRLADLSAGDLAWLGVALGLSGLAPQHPLLQETAAHLELIQAPDGRWFSGEAGAQDVHTTLEALHTLRYYQRF